MEKQKSLEDQKKEFLDEDLGEVAGGVSGVSNWKPECPSKSPTLPSPAPKPRRDL